MRHKNCTSCKRLTDEQLGAEDGIARHNVVTKVGDVPTLIDRALRQTASGHWQASISYFNEAIRELEDARRLAVAMARPEGTDS